VPESCPIADFALLFDPMRWYAVVGWLALGACTHVNGAPTDPAAVAPVERPSAPATDARVSSATASLSAASLSPSSVTSESSAEPLSPPASEPMPPEPFEAPLPDRILPASAPASRLANLSPGQCRAELKRRNLPFKPAPGPSKGVATPLRLTGPLRGVTFRAPGGRSPYGTLDCRLLLALDELAEVLVRHRVTSVRVDNLHRPRARLPGRRKPSQHSYGLAADIMSFTLDDGTELVVERDWVRGPSGSACGPGSRAPDFHPAGIALLNLVCDIARAGLFHHMLTPNHDEAHRDHLHFDLKRGDRTMILE
jgi:hypothetical protein